MIGSAVGDFLLARSGLYLQISTDKNGYAHFFALIKGNDLHSGTSPTADTESVANFIASLKRTFLYVGPENRVVYVLYPNRSAFQREHGVSMTEPTGFESQGTAHTFADDGFPACGTFDDWQRLMALEQYMRDYNFARMARREPNRIPPTFTNLHGKLVTVDIPFDPEFDKEKVDFMRGVFLNMHQLCSFYNLGMTKHMFKQNQATALAEAEARYHDFRIPNKPSISQSSLTASSSMSTVLPSVDTDGTVALRRSLRSHTSSQTTSVQPTRTDQGALHVSASQTTSSAKERNSAQAEDDGQIFEVSMILKHRFNFVVCFQLIIYHRLSNIILTQTGNYEYAVQWKGFGKKDDSYVAESLMK